MAGVNVKKTFAFYYGRIPLGILVVKDTNWFQITQHLRDFKFEYKIKTLEPNYFDEFLVYLKKNGIKFKFYEHEPVAFGEFKHDGGNHDGDTGGRCGCITASSLLSH